MDCSACRSVQGQERETWLQSGIEPWAKLVGVGKGKVQARYAKYGKS